MNFSSHNAKTRKIHEQETVIKPPSASLRLNFREIYYYRHLIANLVRRDIKIQFNQMYLGILWSTVRPLLMMTIFALFKTFSGANLHVSIPFSVYVYSGLILWFYFVEATTNTAKSLEKNASLITKVYFPRIISMIVPVLASFFGFSVAMFPLLIMMLWLGIYPGWKLIALPLVILQCMFLILAVGLIFAALSLESKDFDRLLSQILFIGLYVSPVIFAPGLIPAAARPIYFLNPMAGTLLAFRSTLFNEFPFPLWQWIYSIIATIVLLAIGLLIYQKVEAFIADKL
ncbi:ABC transporter permease [Gloeocapsa sp. PCC 73106]|uniref:ABC transporter permease n=1 Tax=Gloeocapsa sp. PCC 73106 TaxID=102232 RepID=UPI0002AD1293|nr:ABC transporter permease [Gloeocapsa sp. PCC 73106]ELR97721.1 ABC-type polysaccharide/polyol phosphate export system, permease component [Gloeocapsa sp. PCC 73106]